MADPVSFRVTYIKLSADGLSRRGQIVSLLGITRQGESAPSQARVYSLVSVFLAWKELQARSGAILPHLPELLEGCDMQWDYQARDTKFVPLHAAKQLLQATGAETEAEFEAVGGASSSLLPQESMLEDEEEYINLLTEEEAVQIPATPPQHQGADNNPQENSPIPHIVRTAPPITIPPARTIPPRKAETEAPLLTEDQLVFDRGQGASRRKRKLKSSTWTRHQYALHRQPPDTHQPTLPLPFLAQHLATNQSKLQQQTYARHAKLQESRQSFSTTFPLHDNQHPRKLHQEGEEEDLYAFGMIGAFSSYVSETLAILGNALAVPQISGSSTSADLDEFPLFARTIDTDDSQAEAFIHYMKHLNVSHVANIYIKDAYGTSFQQSLVKYADLAGIYMRAISYTLGKETETINNLIESGIRFVFATIREYKPLIRKAYEQGVVGVPGYAWYLSEHFQLTSSGHEETDRDVAHALSGMGLINVYLEPHKGVERALEEFVDNEALQQEFVDRHVHPEAFANFTFLPHAPNGRDSLFFDAVLALGVASCRTPGLFTGPELFEQLLKSEFEGVSGRVSFDQSGNRAFEDLSYRVDNLMLSETRSDASGYRLGSALVAVLVGSNGTTNVTEVNPFLFNNGEYQFTSTIPSPLPPVEEEFNFVPKWAKGLGLALGSSIMLLSLLTMVWVWLKRKKHVIKAAQPPFLVQLCFGTLVYSSSVFPMSLEGGGPDEETNPQKYDAACMCSKWLGTLGFVISFSAILAKTLRLNKLLLSGSRIRRVKIKAKDVMKPFIVLMAINVIGLLGITFVAPFEFRRTGVNNYDEFGRSVESYGACRASSNLVWAFLVPMVLADAVGVIWACHQCYKARNLPLEFSETHYLGMSMGVLAETVVLSSPVLAYLRTNPTAYFLFGTIAVCFLSLAILIPVFLPKWLHRKQAPKLGRAQTTLIANNARGRRGALHNPSALQTIPSTYTSTHNNTKAEFEALEFNSKARGLLDDILEEGSHNGSSVGRLSENSSRGSKGVMKIHRYK